jgi:hypothetical protein
MSFAPLSQTESFSNMVTTTLKRLEPLLTPQIYSAVPVMSHMQKTGKVQMLDGGLQIGVGVVGAENPNFEWYNGSTVAADEEAEQFTRALYDWALARVAVKISDESVDINSGKSQLHNIITEQIENAKSTFINKLSLAINGTRTQTNQLMGFGDFVKEATGVSVGGLSPSSNDYWENERTTTGVTYWASSTLQGNLKEKLRHLYNLCIKKVPAPKRDGIIFVTTMDIFEGYEGSLEHIAQFMLTDARKESLGFGQADDVLSFKQKPFMWDDAAPSGEVKLINTNYLRLAVHNKRNFSWDPARTYPNAHATVSYARFMGQLVCNMRRSQGGLFSVVAAT